jgi:hypothetical protein
VDLLLTLLESGQAVVEAGEVALLVVAHGRWLMMWLRQRLMVQLVMRLMVREWALEAWCVVMEASCREGHASSLDVVGSLLVLLQLVVSEITVPPLCT